MERYWAGYRIVKGWMEKHADVVVDIQEQIDPASNQHSNAVHNESEILNSNYYGQASHSRAQPRRDRSERSVSDKPAGSGTVTTAKRKKRRNKSKSRTGESPNYHVELDQGFIKFMAHSAKHKRDRDAAKSQQERIQAAEKGETERSAAPTEQPGLRRTHEIRLLYGDRAVQVHGLETAQQLTFQQDCDRQKPRFWPNIPLRLNFR